MTRSIGKSQRRPAPTVAAQEYEFTARLDGFVIDAEEAKRLRKEAISARKTDTDIDFDYVLVAMLADTDPFLQFARSKRLLTPKSDAALRRLTRGDIRMPAAERNALKYMLEKMVLAGFELPETKTPARS